MQLIPPTRNTLLIISVFFYGNFKKCRYNIYYNSTQINGRENQKEKYKAKRRHCPFLPFELTNNVKINKKEEKFGCSYQALPYHMYRSSMINYPFHCSRKTQKIRFSGFNSKPQSWLILIIHRFDIPMCSYFSNSSSEISFHISSMFIHKLLDKPNPSQLS